MLTIENSLPIKWSSIAFPIDYQRILEMQENNRQLLFVLLDKHKISTELENETDNTFVELKVLQHKVDILTAWLSKLLVNQMTLPDRQTVKISSKDVTITSKIKFSIEDTLLIECYIEPEFPQALLFYGQVISVTESEPGYEVVIQFINLGTEVSDLLDKLIFQNHRRQVAYTKSMEIPKND